ncbi:hypothetical protein [Nocardia barduliensis]|uniref:hypothetical protein n=1 Tax=Nocardia barduliensis TaxID=2736643 RepID=UPI001572B7F7|nr:hypothetical protein [Nocardia barduliensis]
MQIAGVGLAWGDVIHPPLPQTVGIEPLTGPVAGAVGHVDRLIGRRRDGSRFVPSAGATYPYEILLAAPDTGAIALLDPARKQLVVRADTDFTTDADDYLCLLVGRPWLSMRKYGARGYLYHLIDAGHALFSLALLDREDSAADRFTDGLPGTGPGGAAGDVLAAGLVRAFVPHDGEADGWRLVTTSMPRVQMGRNEFEQWADRLRPPGPPQPVFFDRAGELPGNLARFIPIRRSAAAFGTGAPPGYDLDTVVEGALEIAAAALNRLGLPMPTVHLVGELSAGAALPAGDLLTGLAGQEHLLGAEAFVVFSAPASEDDSTIDAGRQALLLGAGVVGQVLYLVAARHGAGVTGVGGLAPEYWNRALPAGRQTLYLTALGRPVGGEKFDALYQGAHG